MAVFLCFGFFSYWPYQMVFAKRGETISGGNFHGEYPAKVDARRPTGGLKDTAFVALSSFPPSCQALDFLAIAVHELASISERRIERLCNPSLSELPAFLVNEGGLNSGFMIAHCTAASLGGTPTFSFPHRPPLTSTSLTRFPSVSSFREQSFVPPFLCGLLVHQRRHGGPRIHGGLGCQEGPESGGARGAR